MMNQSNNTSGTLAHGASAKPRSGAPPTATQRALDHLVKALGCDGACRVIYRVCCRLAREQTTTWEGMNPGDRHEWAVRVALDEFAPAPAGRWLFVDK